MRRVSACTTWERSSARGEFAAAKAYYEEALALREAHFLPEHPDRVRNLNDLALLHADRGELEAAWACGRQAAEAFEKHLQRVLWSQTESERFRFLESRHTAVAILVSLAGVSGDPEAERVAYEAVLDWKGSATRAMLRGKAQLETGLDDRQRALLADLRATQSELSSLVFRLDPGERDQRMAVLAEQRGRLELELNRSLGKREATTKAELDALLAALPADSAAVDFLILPQYQPGGRAEGGTDRAADGGTGGHAGSFGARQLLAWSMHAGQDGVRRHDLGAAAEVEVEVRDFLEDVVVTRGGASIEEATAGPSPNDALFERLWRPLDESLGAAELVFLSPDSFLGGLPFEILQGADGAYLIEDRAFVYQEDLVSLLAPPRAAASGNGLLVVGGVDYGRRIPGTKVSKSRQYWAGLSATGTEAEAVRQMHHDAFGDDEPSALLIRERDAALVRSHPGLLSGLVCAGANKPVPEAGDDAYLTAEEFSWLPLGGVDTVVLSACETGLGRPQAGEGMLGLRRAFRMAGARTVVSSLWSVRDQATGELMQAYYRNLWLEGKGKLEALRAARLEMLEANRRSKGGRGLPSTWGAFVLSGDWRYPVRTRRVASAPQRRVLAAVFGEERTTATSVVDADRRRNFLLAGPRHAAARRSVGRRIEVFGLRCFAARTDENYGDAEPRKRNSRNSKFHESRKGTSRITAGSRRRRKTCRPTLAASGRPGMAARSARRSPGSARSRP
ncbi:MAG TPA: CHAT domain-containing protein [Planctomycetota bacterium]